jgi:hypothetical protein
MSRPVQVLILAVVAGLIAFAAAATAPFHSPSLAAKYQCPEGSTLRVQEYHASWNTPGETGISIACVDGKGAVQRSTEMETRGFWILCGIYFVPTFAAILIVASLVMVLRRRPTTRQTV